MTELHIALVLVGGLVLVLGLFSGYIKDRTFLSEPLLALLAGVVIGPAVLDLLDPSRWGDQDIVLEEAARLTLAIGLMGVALRLPSGYMARHWRPLAVLILIVMPLMWLSSGLLIYLFLGLPIGVAMLAGAVVTPTDPVVATSIVTGSAAKRDLPDRLRHLLSAESGANDGLAYPIVFICILLLTRPLDDALPHWLLRTLLWDVGIAVLAGALLGYVAGRVLLWAESHKSIENTSFLVYSIALSLIVLGGARLLGTDGVLAVFAAGIAFGATVGGRERSEEAGVQEAVGQFLILPIFAVLGLALPWRDWLELGWWSVPLVAAILLFRRLPWILALNRLISPLQRKEDVGFLGWFGPIGVAALLYSMTALGNTDYEEVWVVGSLVICASIVAHGVTATPLTKLYARRTGYHGPEDEDSVER
ncbi:MAG: cation:proton antiporter [Dehalococcoidia bacterium]